MYSLSVEIKFMHLFMHLQCRFQFYIKYINIVSWCDVRENMRYIYGIYKTKHTQSWWRCFVIRSNFFSFSVALFGFYIIIFVVVCLLILLFVVVQVILITTGGFWHSKTYPLWRALNGFWDCKETHTVFIEIVPL